MTANAAKVAVRSPAWELSSRCCQLLSSGSFAYQLFIHLNKLSWLSDCSLDLKNFSDDTEIVS